MAECLAGLAAPEVERHRDFLAAVLLAAAESLRGRAKWWPADRPRMGEVERLLEQRLDPETLCDCRERGAAMDLPVAVAFAMTETEKVMQASLPE